MVGNGKKRENGKENFFQAVVTPNNRRKAYSNVQGEELVIEIGSR